MSKARDLSNIISGGFTADDIPNLDASKITTGEIANARVADLPASKITSGTLADARISASSVSQHATSFDDNAIVNDISTLALRQASDADRSAYNTNSQFVDVFQDSTGIDTTTNIQRSGSEYVSSISNTNVFSNDSTNGFGLRIYQNGSLSSGGWTSGYTNDRVSTTGNYDGYAINKVFDLSSDFAIRVFPVNSSGNIGGHEYMSATGIILTDTTYAGQANPSNVFLTGSNFAGNVSPANLSTVLHSTFYNNNNIASINQTDVSSSNSNTSVNVGGSNYLLRAYQNNASNSYGVEVIYTASTNTLVLGFMSNTTSPFTLWSPAKITATNLPSTGSFILLFGDATGADQPYYSLSFNGADFTDLNETSYSSVPQISATGNFTGTTITAPSSVSSMGAIITYQDNAGTNALNTDIVLQLSADGGSNYSTATLTALPNFATGIKMAKVNDLAVTAGTNLKYKISFANQASGTKEARIRGVALQY
jgi:hypothetical protein